MASSDDDDFWGEIRAQVATGRFDENAPLLDSSDPVDIWARHDPPELPVDILPPVITRFAMMRSELVGADPGGFAMAALTVCAAAISDKIELRMKRSEDWREQARIWTMLVGDPSYKKSPIMKAASRRISKMDSEMLRQYNRDLQRWHDMDKDGPAPVPTRLRIEDITMEAAQEVCEHSPDGVLALQDELSGWFGGIEKYSGGKGGAKDRSFWLRAFNGGEYAVNRISRKSTLIDNLSITILGGIQPDAIRKIMTDSTDDGLIQRFFPIVLRPSKVGQDKEVDGLDEYDALIERLHALKPIDTILGIRHLRFSDEAQAIRNQLEDTHHHMATSMERVNKKLASHIGKLDGLFGRLCVLFHCIEAASSPSGVLQEEVSVSVAGRVSQLIHGYLMRHAIAFYNGVIGMSDDQTALEDVAGYILAHKVEHVTMRTLQRGSRTMRRLTRQEGARIFEQLEALGWLEQLNRRSDSPSWRVDERVHYVFDEKAKAERNRRKEEMAVIKAMIEGGSHGGMVH